MNKSRYLMMTCLMLTAFILSGCYRNWDELDAFAGQIDCQTTKSQAITLAEKYATSVEWDETYLLLSIGKAQDAMALQFIPESFGSDIIRLDTLSAVKSRILYLGLHRLQGDTYLLLRCR